MMTWLLILLLTVGVNLTIIGHRQDSATSLFLGGGALVAFVFLLVEMMS